MGFTHLNHEGRPYYLHVGTSKTGKPRYWFSRKDDGDLAAELPEGYEVYEDLEKGQVHLRRSSPQAITPFELALTERALRRFARDERCVPQINGSDIVVFHAERQRDLERALGAMPGRYLYSRFQKILRFQLVDPDSRLFRAQRWCFRGSVDTWIDLHFHVKNPGPLVPLVEALAPHLGRESFFELR